MGGMQGAVCEGGHACLFHILATELIFYDKNVKKSTACPQQFAVLQRFLHAVHTFTRALTLRSLHGIRFSAGL